MNCCICGQIAGDPSNDLLASISQEKTYRRRTVFETENFAVFPSVGPLVPGHVILCPKSHVRSMAALPALLDSEFDTVWESLSGLLTDTYGMPVHFFEHGMSHNVGSRILCTVDHAHLHAVPTQVSITTTIKKYPQVSVQDGISGLRKAVGTNEYVFYAGPDGDRIAILSEHRALPSQFLRQAFAEALGNSADWNWREHLKPEETLRTLQVLTSNFGRSSSFMETKSY